MTPKIVIQKMSKTKVIVILILATIGAFILTYLTLGFSIGNNRLNFWGDFSNLFIGIAAFILFAIIFRKYIPPSLSNWLKKRKKIFIFLDLIVHELLPNRIGVLVILLMLVLFFGMGQAAELLLHLSQSPWSPPVFFGVLLILALLNWYWVRFLYTENISVFTFRKCLSYKFKNHLGNQDQDQEQNQNQDPNITHVRGMLPKFIGLIIILIPTLFILKLYANNVWPDIDKSVKIFTGIVFWFLLIIGYAFLKKSFYVVVRDWLSSNKWIWRAALVVFGVLTLGLFFYSLQSNGMESPKRIPLLYYSGALVTLLYFLITTLKIKKAFTFPKQEKKKRNAINYFIFFGAILISVFFLAFNIYPIVFKVNGLIVLFSGLVLYSLVCFILIILGKLKNVPFLTILLVVGSIFSILRAPNSSLHNIRLTEKESVFNVNNRVSIQTYIRLWFKSHSEQIKAYNKEKYPLVFVSSEGGGSRAAMWTSLVHNYLENNVENYYDHIFSMSGASGGNTGNSFYMAYHEVAEEGDNLDLISSKIFNNDFISSDIGLLFGRDAWQSMLGVSWWGDRAEILQQRWENEFSNAFDHSLGTEINPLRKDFLSFWYDKNEPDMKKALRFKHPLFLLNTTHIQSGDHATMSAVKMNGFIPQNMDLLSAVYNIDLATNKKSIPLSTGTLLNARFPIVCPSGKISYIGNFVDAGYYDNFGASETQAVINAVITFLDNNKLGFTRDSFNLIHLVHRNGVPDGENPNYTSIRSNKESKSQEKYKVLKHVSEAVVPINTLLNTAYAHPNRELAEIEWIVDTTIYFDLKRTVIISDGERIRPIIPLSRHLSKLTIESMRARIDTVMSKSMVATLDSLFILK